MADFRIVTGDALKVLQAMQMESVDVVVTSPRYNFGKNYGDGISDKTPMPVYFEEMRGLALGLFRVVKNGGVLFLNVGTRSENPLHDFEVVQQFLVSGWKVQERIIWQKADENGTGHFTPISSKTHLNNVWETVFVLTQSGEVELDRLAIGVPYKDQTNVKRWKHGRALRCRGDIWFIPYPTIRSRDRERGGHEATFPRELVERCLKLVEFGRTGLTVLDPCCGTGTVPAVACERGHYGFGIELNPEYAEMAFKRVSSAIPGSLGVR